MPSSRDLYLIDARLSYLEEILASLFHISVDPPPPDVARGGGFQAEFRRRPGGPIVDPAVSDRLRLAELLMRRPPQGDPAVSDRVRLAETLLRRPPHGDPAVSDRVRLEIGEIDPIVAEWIARLLAGVDPPPEDLTRLTAGELAATARVVGADIVRLKSIEGLLNERLQEVNAASGGGA
jgi:hypothetical protein